MSKMKSKLVQALVLPLAMAVAAPIATSAHADTVRIAPSGGDDTDAIRCAIEFAGPDGVVELSAGTFRISESIIVRQSVRIKGAGRNRTAVIADASLAPGGIYPVISEAERTSLEMEFALPFAFVFHVQEERFGRYALRDLTLGMSGLAAPHYDPNTDEGDSERLHSLVWVQGFDGFWLNSAGESPTDIGELDAEHRVLSTVRFRCANVFFDGKNRNPSAPDVEHAFVMEGGFVFSHLDEFGEEVIDWLLKPLNANVSFTGCRFADFPAHTTIYNQLVTGRDDPFWTFGPEAVEGAVIVRDCDFVRTRNAFAVYDQSDTRVVIEDCSFKECSVGVFYSNDYQLALFEWIGYPETAMCELLVADSIFRDASHLDDLGFAAAVLVEDYLRGHTVDARIRDCRFRLEGEGVGIRFFGSQGAVVRDCDFRGPGEAGIYALDAEGLRLDGNDFCHLAPSNPGEASVVVAGTTTIVDIDNDCLDFFTEP